ncbi:hypothetical protein M8J77_005866 [Diaphorina citri]|nr:hypothetical protein M8J77_005866 [Diaphorina citri]
MSRFFGSDSESDSSSEEEQVQRAPAATFADAPIAVITSADIPLVVRKETKETEYQGPARDQGSVSVLYQNQTCSELSV